MNAPKSPSDPQEITFPKLSFGTPFQVGEILEAMKVWGHSAWLGMHYHAMGDDWVELAMPWSEALVADSDTGILASGPIISLLDNTTGLSVWQKRGMLLPQVTVDLHIDYMRPAVTGKAVIARATCYRLARSVAFVRGIAYDDNLDDPIAHAVGTFMLIDEPLA